MRKRKKSTRYRGSKTHGYGSMKKHRGAGHRGGRGNAGTGKRGDAKKPSVWGQRYFGKYGFQKKPSDKGKSINVSDIDKNLDVWLTEKKITTEKDVYVVDLKSVGYDKVLGSGNLTRKIKLSSAIASAKAREKIEAAGGEVLLLGGKSAEFASEPA